MITPVDENCCAPTIADMPVRNQKGVSISEAIRCLLIAKKLCNCRPRYIASLKQFLAHFARGREERPIDSFDVFSVEAWLAERNYSLSSRVGKIGRLSALFSFSVRRGWSSVNPCGQLERIRMEPARPKILNPEQCERLMRWCQFQKPAAMAYLALTLFCGVRPEETEKIQWDAIDRGGKVVVIDACASKVRRRRIIDLHPTALEWLDAAKAEGELPLGGMKRRRMLKEARKVLGFDSWPQDVLRHTAASFMMAKYRDAGLVANWLGNSPSILLRHYRELVSSDAASAFWRIRP